MTTATRAFPGVPGSVRQAREFVRHALAAAQCPAAADAEVCVSELVTNAIRHSRSAGPAGQVHIRLVVTAPTSVQIEVRDDGPADGPASCGAWRDGALVLPDVLAEGGRGLYLIGALAERAGMDPEEGLAWCRLAWGKPGDPVPGPGGFVPGGER